MKTNDISRRSALARGGLLLGAAVAIEHLGISSLEAAPAAPTSKTPPQFTYCLNTATIRGQKLGIVKEVEIVAQAGYNAIEPWIGTLDEYVKGGGSLSDLRKRIADLGLTVESAIGFPEWMVDDDARRAKGLEQAKHDMDLVAQIGGKRIAAPPAGATDVVGMPLLKAAERYRALLEVGDGLGVIPQLEHWSFAKSLGRFGECMGAAAEAGHPQACVLADIFHLFKSGSPFNGMDMLTARAAQVIHMNDYPADPPREKQDDSFRDYPGNGVAPLGKVLRMVREAGGARVLSLELFNREYWKQDALSVCQTGLAKLKRVVESSGQG